MNRVFFIFFILIFILNGCAGKFGHKIIQTTIEVTSEPKEINYYIISPHDDCKLNPKHESELLFSENPNYIVFLQNKAIKKRAGNVLQVQPAGTRVIWAVCDNKLKRYSMLLKKNTVNKLKIICE